MSFSLWSWEWSRIEAGIERGNGSRLKETPNAEAIVDGVE
jgi:hypothetical protein